MELTENQGKIIKELSEKIRELESIISDTKV